MIVIDKSQESSNKISFCRQNILADAEPTKSTQVRAKTINPPKKTLKSSKYINKITKTEQTTPLNFFLKIQLILMDRDFFATDELELD